VLSSVIEIRDKADMVTRCCVRCLPSGVGVLKGLLYAVGGHDGPLVRKSCEVYDPASNSWRQVADMNMCRRNAGNTDRLSSRAPQVWDDRRIFIFFVCVCVCFRHVCCEQRTVCGGRRRRQLQFSLCGVLQSKLGQVDAAADLHEHRTQLCRCVENHMWTWCRCVENHMWTW